jgi:hypothetical protein
MPNINTALISLWSKASRTHPSYMLILTFLLLLFAMFSQRIFGITSQYYIIFATVIILSVMILITLSIFSSEPKLIENNFLESINTIFDSPSSRNFLSVVALVLFIILVYELVEYDNNDPHYVLDKIMFGKNKYISNRTSGILLIFFFSLLTSYTIMTTTRE